MLIRWLVDFNQHASSALGVDEYHPGTVCPGRRRIRQKLVAPALQSLHIGIDIVRTETQVMQTTAFLLQERLHGAFIVERMYQFDAGGRKRQERGGGLGLDNVLRAPQWKLEILHEPFYRLLQIRHRHGDVIERCNHACSPTMFFRNPAVASRRRSAISSGETCSITSSGTILKMG